MKKVKAKLEFELFLLDKFIFSEIINDVYYFKNIITNSSLVILYKSNNQMGEELSQIGVFDTSTRSFVVVVNGFSDIFENDTDYQDRASLYMSALQTKLQTLIKSEINSVIEILSRNIVNTGVDYEREVLEEATNHFINNSIPIFKYPTFDFNLNLNNLVDFVKDENDFAYNCAEEILNKNNTIVEEYKKYTDINEKLTELKNVNVDYLDARKNLISIFKGNYKNITYIYEKDNKDFEVNKENDLEILNTVPFYSIKQVKWSRTILYTRNIQNIDKLKQDIEYNLSIYENKNKEYFENLPIELRSSEVFLTALYKQNQELIKYFEYVSDEIKENEHFIEDVLNISNGYSCVYIYKNISDKVRMNIDLSVLFIKQNVNCFSYIPKSLELNEDILLTFLENANESLMEDLNINTYTLKNPIIYNKLIEVLNKNPKLATAKLVPFIEDKDALIKIIQEKNNHLFQYIPNSFRESEQFILELIDVSKLFYFDVIYDYLSDDLKKNEQLVLELIQKSTCLSYLQTEKIIFNSLIDDLKNDLNFQEKICNRHKNFLKVVDISVQKKIISQDGNDIKCLYGDNLNHRNTTNVNLELIQLAAISKPETFKLADYKIRNNKVLVLSMLTQNPYIYEYISQELKQDNDVLDIVTQQISILKYLPEKNKYSKSFLDDKDIVIKCLQHDVSDLRFIPSATKRTNNFSLLDDKEVILTAVKLVGNSVKYLKDKSELLKDLDIAFISLLDNLNNICYFHSSVSKNEDFILKTIEECYKTKKQMNNMEDFIDGLPGLVKNSKTFSSKLDDIKNNYL